MVATVHNYQIVICVLKYNVLQILMSMEFLQKRFSNIFLFFFKRKNYSYELCTMETWICLNIFSSPSASSFVKFNLS